MNPDRLEAALLGDTPSGRIVTWTLFCIAVGAAFLSFPPNHDVAAILDLTERHLAGERLYHDIAEPNPPWIFVLAAAPALLSALTGVSDLWLAQALCVLTEVGTLFLAGHIVSAGWPTARRHALLILTAALLFAWSNMHIGQREHLWIGWSLPWLALVLRRADGHTPPQWQAVGAGLFAASGFAFKPYFLPAFLVAEAWLAWRAGRRMPLRTEVVTMAVSAAAWSLLVLASGYLPNAQAFRGLYSAYNETPETMFALSRVEVWAPVLLGVAFAPLPEDRRAWRPLVLGLVVAWAASGILQLKGWRYHWVPLWLGGGVGLGLLLVHVRKWGPLATFAVALVTLADARRITLIRWHSLSADVVIDLADRMKKYAVDGRILYLTSDAHPTYPPLRMIGAHAVNRAPLIFVPGLYADVDPKVRPFPLHVAPGPAELAVVRALTDDLLRARPSLVVVDERPIKEGFGQTTFDWLAFAAQDPRWKDAFSGWRKVRGAWETGMYLRADLPDPYEQK